MSKVKAITINMMENNYTRRTMFRFLLSGIIILCILYVYFIGSITFNILARKSLESNSRTLGSNVSQLELTYLANSSKIDRNYALSKGFVDARNNIFVARSTSHVAIR